MHDSRKFASTRAMAGALAISLIGAALALACAAAARFPRPVPQDKDYLAEFRKRIKSATRIHPLCASSCTPPSPRTA